MAIAGPIKLTGKFQVLKFDGIKFTKDLQERSMRLMRKAAVAFLNASTERIPKRTSFARGGFDNLASALGVPGREGPRNTTPRKGGEYYYLGPKRRVRKSREAGSRFSTKARIENILQTNFPTTISGKIVAFVVKRKPNLTFNYNVSIRYINANEDKWHALQAGLDAFRLVLTTEAKSVVPKITDYQSTETKTVG